MAYTNKVSAAAAVAIAILFLSVAFAPQWTEAEPTPPMPKVDPECRVSILDIAQNCYSTLSAIPSEECCTGLKSASSKQVTCLCDNFIAHPVYGNISRPFYNQINTACGVLDKYVCDGTSTGGEEKKEEGSSSQNTTSTSNGSKTDNNGGATKTIAASMSVFGLVASMLFAMF